jgi:signal transduction histidine kinase
MLTRTVPHRVRTAVAALPLRLRLTLAFTGTMAVVLVATGLFIHARLASSLDRAIDDRVRAEARSLVLLVRAGGDLSRGGELAQVLTPEGSVIDGNGQLRGPLLTPGQARAAVRGPLEVETTRIPGFGDPARLYARPAEASGGTLVVVAGTSLRQRREAMRSLSQTLLIGGLVALALAALAGWLVAAGALRPIDRMRRHAEEIGERRLDERLPVPPGDDEVARLGTTLNAMLARLRDAFAHERAFAANASHELRTPLAILRTELELAREPGRTPDELRAAIASAADETERLGRLADDLLVLARADHGRLPVRPGTVEARALLEHVRDRFALAAGEREVRVAAVDPRLVLTVDPERVQQALGNLVDNALRHGEGPVELSAVNGDRTVRLLVADRGPGFPPWQRDGAFERFARPGESRLGGGTGLGLAIVRAIAEAHGGRAGAGDRAGGGAEVWLELPAGGERAQD